MTLPPVGHTGSVKWTSVESSEDCTDVMDATAMSTELKDTVTGTPGGSLLKFVSNATTVAPPALSPTDGLSASTATPSGSLRVVSVAKAARAERRCVIDIPRSPALSSGVENLTSVTPPAALGVKETEEGGARNKESMRIDISDRRVPCGARLETDTVTTSPPVVYT